MNKKIVLVVVLVVIGSTIFFLESQKSVPASPGIVEVIEVRPVTGVVVEDFSAESVDQELITSKVGKYMAIEEKEKKYERAKEITTPDGFINTDEISLSKLVGNKVILVDFWTYSCINCQRTTPYLNAWYEKYKDKGLEIIGVHTPEFEFEKKYENVLGASNQFGIKYPVVLDNDYSTWHAYRNRYWPRKYLIDIDGFIVYDHIGEGGYEETEKRIQSLLAERMSRLGVAGEISDNIVKPEGAEGVDFTNPRSPEVYFGSLRNNFLGNGKASLGTTKFTLPEGIKTNILYLEGDWKFTSEYAENISDKAKIVFRYQGQKVFMVASADREVQVTVTLDGEPLQSLGVRGKDVTSDKLMDFLRVEDERLYRVVEDVDWGEHTLELIIESPGLKAFTFTFG